MNIKKNHNNILVTSLQTTSTPGFKINKCFKIYKNTIYLLEVNGYASKPNNAFIWVIDESKKRLIKNYTFLNINNSTVSGGFKLNYNTLIHIGVLFTSPNINDTFVINNISLYSVSENYLNDGTTLCNVPNKTPYSNIINCKMNGCLYSGSSYPNEITYSLCRLFNYPRLNIPESNLINFAHKSITNSIEYNINIPSGYVFLGQFITHDLSFNKHSLLNLNTLYGECNYLFSKNKFIISKKHDLNRNKDGIAIIPDSRNDENYIIAQLHLLFQLFH